MDLVKKYFEHFVKISPKCIIDMYDVNTAINRLFNQKSVNLIASIIEEYKNTFLALIGFEDQFNAKHWYTNVLISDHINAYRKNAFDPIVERKNITDTIDFLVHYFIRKNTEIDICNVNLGRLVVFSRWLNRRESYQMADIEYYENIDKFSEFLSTNYSNLCQQCQKWLVDAYHIQRDPQYMYDMNRIRYHSDDYSNTIITNKSVYIDDYYGIGEHDIECKNNSQKKEKCNCFD